MTTNYQEAWAARFRARHVPESAEYKRAHAGILPSFADIPKVPTIYLATEPLILPRGDVVLLAGPAGYGKGNVIAWLTSAVTRGALLDNQPGSVIHIGLEDDRQRTTSWRLAANDADLSRVYDLTTIPGGAEFSLDATGKTTGSVALLRAKIDELREAGANPVMWTIDPLRRTVASGSIQTDAGAAHTMIPLMRLCEETGTVGLIAHHTTKDGEIAGSKGLVNAARVVYLIKADPYNARVKLATLEKANGIDRESAKPAAYIIDGEGKSAHAVWGAARDVTRDIPAWRAAALLTARPEAIEGEPRQDADPLEAMYAEEDSTEDTDTDDDDTVELPPQQEGADQALADAIG